MSHIFNVHEHNHGDVDVVDVATAENNWRFSSLASLFAFVRENEITAQFTTREIEFPTMNPDYIVTGVDPLCDGKHFSEAIAIPLPDKVFQALFDKVSAAPSKKHKCWMLEVNDDRSAILIRLAFPNFPLFEG